MRTKIGVARHKRHKKLKSLTKGYRGMRSTTVKMAKQAMMKAGRNAYRDRRLKKRDFRSLWIVRLNAAVRAEGMSYSRFIAGLKKKNVALDRKTLSELAINEPAVFAKVLKHIA